MAVANTRVGAPVDISIGHKGQRPDIYPARICGPVQIANINGRMTQQVPVIFVAKNLAREEYLAERLHNLAFAFDREDRVVMLDGTAAEPKTWQELVADRSRAAKAFLATLPESGQVLEVAELGI